MIFLLIAAFIFIVMLEVPKLIRDKSWRELIAFSFFISIAFIISLLYTMKIKIPNPVKDMQYFVKDLLHLGYD